MNDPHAQIIAEMRRRIAVKMSDAWYTQEEWAKLCDRLEAAVSCLRNALDRIIRLTKVMDYDAGPQYVETITDKIRTTAAEAGFVFDANEGVYTNEKEGGAK